MPAKSAYKGSLISENDGPAIKMDPADHKETASHGNWGLAGQEYRDKQQKLLQQGKFKEALQMDIDDVRKIAKRKGYPDKYECAIKQVIDHANTIDHSKFILK